MEVLTEAPAEEPAAPTTTNMPPTTGTSTETSAVNVVDESIGEIPSDPEGRMGVIADPPVPETVSDVADDSTIATDDTVTAVELEITTDCWKEGAIYLGSVNVTGNGYSCQDWNSNLPHRPKYVPPSGSENYCRAPDAESKGVCTFYC